MKKSYILILFLLFSLRSVAQIETMYSMYRINPIISSPAFAGTMEEGHRGEIVMMDRQQWLGIQGAPRTLALTANFQYKPKIGGGFLLLADQAGPLRVATMAGDLAYHVQFNPEWSMAGGIRLGVSSVYLDYDGIQVVDPNDPILATNKGSGLKGNTGWGVRFNHKGGFFASLSMPRVLSYDFGGFSGAYKDVTYLYINAGTTVRVNDQLSFSPSFMARAAQDVPLSWDMNVMARIGKAFDAGLAYRHKDSYGLRFGMQANPKIYLGYIYEMPISGLSKVSNQTHEIALRLSILNRPK
jgi:type IX secretion system PorP/SprF family membrane protein